MESTKKIGFAGTDGRTFLSAFTVSTALSDIYKGNYRGCVVEALLLCQNLQKE